MNAPLTAYYVAACAWYQLPQPIPLPPASAFTPRCSCCGCEGSFDDLCSKCATWVANIRAEVAARRTLRDICRATLDAARATARTRRHELLKHGRQRYDA